MKTKHLFWGFLFITLGILIFINNFTSINFDWLNIWQFWPLFLILFGISLLIKQETLRAVIISITGIILGAAIFSTVNSGWNFFHDEVFDERQSIEISGGNRKVFEENYSENIKNASLFFKSGAGSFKISDTTSNLVYAITNGYDNYTLDRVDKGENSKINLQNNRERLFVFRGKNRNRVNINLNTNPVWKLNFDLGAASSEFDLRKFKVEELKVDAGAASLKIFLGDLLSSQNIDIDAGASSIEINIPENSGCEVKSDIVLSNRDFEGFNKMEDNIYRTDNFNSAPKKIYMNIDTGVSSIKIKRYSGEGW